MGFKSRYFTNSELYVNNGRVGVNTTDPTSNLQVVGSFSATTKSFVIDHPSKEGMKLRYASLEGPENGVYVRGKTTESVIELPDYWKDLVDEETITVNLTSKNKSAYNVDEVSLECVKISSDSGEIDCYYTIFAERKDVDKLVVEYS